MELTYRLTNQVTSSFTDYPSKVTVGRKAGRKEERNSRGKERIKV
jgi:hypothetical protein